MQTEYFGNSLGRERSWEVYFVSYASLILENYSENSLGVWEFYGKRDVLGAYSSFLREIGFYLSITRWVESFSSLKKYSPNFFKVLTLIFAFSFSILMKLSFVCEEFQESSVKSRGKLDLHCLLMDERSSKDSFFVRIQCFRQSKAALLLP